MKITKKLIKQYVKEKLSNDETWQMRAFQRIYDLQTPTEQSCETTNTDNGVGFTGTDGTILTSIGNQLRKRGKITPKQKAIVIKKMPKYWKQIVSISDHKKLVRCMIADGYVTEKDAFMDYLNETL